jgi:hypothetical protein
MVTGQRSNLLPFPSRFPFQFHTESNNQITGFRLRIGSVTEALLTCPRPWVGGLSSVLVRSQSLFSTNVQQRETKSVRQLSLIFQFCSFRQSHTFLSPPHQVFRKQELSYMPNWCVSGAKTEV